MTTTRRDWVARPAGRFVVWFAYIVAVLAFIGVLFGILQVVGWGITWLTGSERVSMVLSMVILLALVAAFNAWIWTATGNPLIKRMIRLMQRMEGRP